MSKRNGLASSDQGYISYGDALDWMTDFSRAYRCIVDWKLTVRRENDGSIGTYVTAFVKSRDQGGKLVAHQVVRFGKGQDSVTAPAAMVKALILLDRELGSYLDKTDDDAVSTDPAVPL